jgi:hypothetical protein
MKRVPPVGFHLYQYKNMHGSLYTELPFWMAGYHKIYHQNVCAVNHAFSVDDALSCVRGGFTFHPYGITADLISEVCHNVCIEPVLKPLSSKTLPPSSVCTDGGSFGYSGGWFLGL